ncbi:hypothetical protein [Endothiovibrio diazotrophicus]
MASALKTLAAGQWRHPLHGHAIQFSVPTLERWYYRSRHAADPEAALRPRRREDAGRLQWYLHERAEPLVHGLSQAPQKHDSRAP